MVNIFDNYKKEVNHYLQVRNCEKAAKAIESAAFWATWYYFTYTDSELEQYVKDVVSIAGSVKAYQPIKGRLAFVCSYMHDNGELVRHYVRAIKDNNIPTMMIVIDKKVAFGYANTLKEIENANNIELVLISPNMGYVETAKRIASIIEEYKPEKILQHFTPYETKCLLGVSMIPDIPKYNINYTDHTYWLGASLLDCNIEFRPYGCQISLEKRNIPIERMRLLPYYPIIEDSVPFEGIPFENDNKIVFFSGGAPYKMIGDNDLFFKILDRILQENENAVALIVAGNTLVKEKIMKMQNHHKVYTVSFRHDIYELMKHIDVFYSTYPVGGGLMTMIAASSSKPIVSFTKEDNFVADVDGLLNTPEEQRIAFYSIDKLCEYVNSLCNDDAFRQSEGERMYSLLQTRVKFASQFEEIINGHQNLIITSSPHIFNYENMLNNAVYNSRNSKEYINQLIRNDRLAVFYKYPQYLDLFLKRSFKFIFFRLFKNWRRLKFG